MNSTENTDVANVAIVHEEESDPQFTPADSTTTPSRVELAEYHPMGSTYKVVETGWPISSG